MNIIGIILLLVGLAICWFIGNSYYKRSISKTRAIILIVLVSFFSVRLALRGLQGFGGAMRPRRLLWIGFLLSSLMTLLGLFRMTAAGNLMACGCVDGSCSCNSGKACCGKKGCVCKNGGTCLCDTKASKKTVTENRIDGTSVDTEFNKTTFVNGVPVYSGKKDNLKVIEGIGPVIEGFLNDHGIISFEQIGAMQPEEVKKILDRAKERFLTHTTESRPLQARFAAAGRKKELQEMKNELDGGKFIAGGKYTKDSV